MNFTEIIGKIQDYWKKPDSLIKRSFDETGAQAIKHDNNVLFAKSLIYFDVLPLNSD